MKGTRNSFFDGSSLFNCRGRQMGVGSNSSSEALQKGSVILLVLFVSAVFAVLAPVAGTLALSEARIARSHAVQNTALYIAEAGQELAIARLRTDSAFTTPANTPITGTLNGGSFSVSVTAGTGSERIITATGNWGGGQQRVAARVSFSQAPLQTFLFQHTLLSGGDVIIDYKDPGVYITGPVQVKSWERKKNNPFETNQPRIGDVGNDIPSVNVGHYKDLARNNPLWLRTTETDLANAIDTAVINSIQRILITSLDNHPRLNKVELKPNSPVEFTGLIVIDAATVQIKSTINNANEKLPLVILTTGDIDINPGQRGGKLPTLGNSTLLYSNGIVEFELSSAGGTRDMTGIVVAKGIGNKLSKFRNINLAYCDDMLPLLQQDAQPDFRQTQADGAGMNVTFINPQP